MTNKPKTAKIYIPGEVLKLVEEHTFQDGSTAVIETMAPIVVPSKKNQQVIRISKKIVDEELVITPYLLDSKQHQKWERTQFKVFTAAANKLALEGFSLPIVRAKIKVIFYFPDSKDRDLSNKFETIADILVDAGILIDDKFKVLNPVIIEGYVNRLKPRTEIYLTLIPGTSPAYEWDITPPEHAEIVRKRRNLRRRINSDKKRVDTLLRPVNGLPPADQE